MTVASEPKHSKIHPVLARTLADPAYTARLEDDPRTALEEVFGPLPKHMEFKVVRNTGSVKYLHIPLPPSQEGVSDAELFGVHGGTTAGCLATASAFTIVSFTITGAISLADTF